MKKLIMMMMIVICLSCQHTTDWKQINKKIINEFDMKDIKLDYIIIINPRMNQKGFGYKNIIVLKSEDVSDSVKIHEIAHKALRIYIKKYNDVPIIVHELFAQEAERRIRIK